MIARKNCSQHHGEPGKHGGLGEALRRRGHGDRDNEQECKWIFEPASEEKKGRQLKHVIAKKHERRLAREELRARIGDAQQRVQPRRYENDRQAERKRQGMRDNLLARAKWISGDK